MRCIGLEVQQTQKLVLLLEQRLNVVSCLASTRAQFSSVPPGRHVASRVV